MKKFFALLLAVSLSVVTLGCDEGKKDDKKPATEPGKTNAKMDGENKMEGEAK